MSTFKPFALLMLSSALLSACASPEADQALSSDVSSSQVIQEGVPDSVTTEVEQIRAVVSAIDYAKRTFTLQDARGHPPHPANRAGDGQFPAAQGRRQG